MRIAVCDDDPRELDNITEYLEDYRRIRRCDLSYQIFDSSVELAEASAVSPYDIYLLDVIMPVLNGIELAQEIREFDRAADLIFLTSSPEYAVDSYTVKASNYLLKPLEREKFFQALDDILDSRVAEEESHIIVSSSIGVHRIPLSSLMYVEALNRRVIYYAKNGEQLECIADRFSNVCETLMEHPEFILPHRSFLVNMNFIQSIQGSNMILTNGKVIPLAQRRVAEIKKHYLAFQMEEITP